MRGGWRYLSSHTLIGDQHLSVLTQTLEWMVWWDIWDYSKAWIFSKRWSPIGLWVQDLSMSVTTLLYEWDRALWSRLVNVSHNTALGCVCVCVNDCSSCRSFTLCAYVQLQLIEDVGVIDNLWLCESSIESTLKKKQYVLAYHFVREGVARDEWRTEYVNTDENLADVLTKPLSGPKRIKLVRMVLHHIYPEKDNGDTVGD